MKSSLMWVCTDEFAGVSGLTLPSPATIPEAPQRSGGGHTARYHAAAETCFGCVDWYSYDRLEHGRVESSWQATAAR